MEMTPQERRMLMQYTKMSDAEILDLVRNLTKKLGHPPRKQDMLCPWYLKQRFGPWHRILETAGVKPVSEKQQKKNQLKECRRLRAEAKRSKKS